MLQIAPATPADTELIAQLVRELADYERLAHEARAEAADFHAALFRPEPRVYCDIARWQREPAGFAVWYYSFSTFEGRHGLYLEDLFVRPPLRRRGIGTALLRHLAARCVREGLARFEWSVLNWNTPAIDFYRAVGARPMSDWTVWRLSGAALQALGAATVR
ncbi:MAG: GNAT family N-acetyltransferase [Steroidobacteraceae bacterium]|nr:GNAT family N-acetyltransferase [Steroidobacteraceae bacterium]MDW8257977.1 GNAT family N-acetyltransferase [Gammaproteobacteria bacterium]